MSSPSGKDATHETSLGKSNPVLRVSPPVENESDPKAETNKPNDTHGPYNSEGHYPVFAFGEDPNGRDISKYMWGLPYESALRSTATPSQKKTTNEVKKVEPEGNASKKSIQI